MPAEVGENAIDIALKVARALATVGVAYFLGGSATQMLPVTAGKAAAVLKHAVASNPDGVVMFAVHWTRH